ncbi:MAG: hypothetical protein Q7R33_05055 [Nitrosarchaeum sp.]|nr:hypothetical protein [Nitrosarchaeum sp.]
MTSIIVTNLDSAGVDSSLPTYQSATKSPAANRLQFFWVSQFSATAGYPTITGCSLTWVAVDSISTVDKKMILFRSMGAAPTTGKITISYTGINPDRIVYGWVECQNMDESGTFGSGAIVQINKTSVSGASEITVPMSVFTSNYNATVAFFSGVNSQTAGSGFVQINSASAVGAVFNAIRGSTQWTSTIDRTVKCSFGFGDCLGIAIEVKLLEHFASSYIVDELSAGFNPWWNADFTGINTIIEQPPSSGQYAAFQGNNINTWLTPINTPIAGQFEIKSSYHCNTTVTENGYPGFNFFNAVDDDGSPPNETHTHFEIVMHPGSSIGCSAGTVAISIFKDNVLQEKHCETFFAYMVINFRFVRDYNNYIHFYYQIDANDEVGFEYTLLDAGNKAISIEGSTTQSIGAFYFQADSGLPEAEPLNLVVVAGSPFGNVNTSWDPITGITSYTLQRATLVDFSDAIDVYTGATNAFIDTVASGTYYYRVKATLPVIGDSGWSDAASITLLLPPPNLTVVRDLIYGDVDASWDSVAGATQYVLQRDTNASFTSPIDIYTGAAISFIDTVSSLGTYYYRVKAQNLPAESDWSTIESITFSLSAPINLTAVNAVIFGNIDTAWNTVIDATDYVLERDTNPGFSSPVIVYIGAINSFTDSVLSLGTYYYRVKAQNILGTSIESLSATVIVSLATPINLQAIAISPPGDINTSWNTVANATSYSLQRATNPSFTGAITVYVGAVASFLDQVTSPNTYYYHVKAISSIGESLYSTTVSLVISLPDIPLNLTAVNAVTPGDVNVNWSVATGAVQYVLERALLIDFSDAITVYIGATNGFVDTVYDSETYHYRVKSRNAVGDSGYSTIATVIVVIPSTPYAKVGIVQRTNRHVIKRLKTNVIPAIYDSVVFGTFGTPGSSTSTLHGPRQITRDNAGRIYVCDFENQRIVGMTSNYTYVAQYNTASTVGYPCAIFYDSTNDDLYVVGVTYHSIGIDVLYMFVNIERLTTFFTTVKLRLNIVNRMYANEFRYLPSGVCRGSNVNEILISGIRTTLYSVIENSTTFGDGVAKPIISANSRFVGLMRHTNNFFYLNDGTKIIKAESRGLDYVNIGDSNYITKTLYGIKEGVSESILVYDADSLSLLRYDANLNFVNVVFQDSGSTISTDLYDVADFIENVY